MADELNLQTKVAFNKGGTSVAFPDANAQIINVNVAGDRFIQNRQSIGIVAEPVDIGDISLGGYAAFINRDATNYVDLLDAASGVIFCRLKPGELAVLRLHLAGGAGPLVLSALANLAPIDLEYLIIED